MLEINNLTVKYGSVVALENVSPVLCKTSRENFDKTADL